MPKFTVIWKGKMSAAPTRLPAPEGRGAGGGSVGGGFTCLAASELLVQAGLVERELLPDPAPTSCAEHRHKPLLTQHCPGPPCRRPALTRCAPRFLYYAQWSPPPPLFSPKTACPSSR